MRSAAHLKREILKEPIKFFLVLVEKLEIFDQALPQLDIDLDIFLATMLVVLPRKIVPVCDLGLGHTEVYTVTLKTVLRPVIVDIPRHGQCIIQLGRDLDAENFLKHRHIVTNNVVANKNGLRQEKLSHLIVVKDRLRITTVNAVGDNVDLVSLVVQPVGLTVEYHHLLQPPFPSP